MTDDTDDDQFQPYVKPDPAWHPAIIAERLMLHDEHKHLAENDVKIDYLMACEGVFKGGKTVIGAVHLPTVQGRLKSLFEMMLAEYLGEMPHFLMVIDLPWWREATATHREALVWHELCHIRQEVDKFGELKFDRDGNPSYGLREHDIAAFNSEVARYGAWSPDLAEFLAAAGQ